MKLYAIGNAIKFNMEGVSLIENCREENGYYYRCPSRFYIPIHGNPTPY